MWRGEQECASGCCSRRLVVGLLLRCGGEVKLGRFRTGLDKQAVGDTRLQRVGPRILDGGPHPAQGCPVVEAAHGHGIGVRGEIAGARGRLSEVFLTERHLGGVAMLSTFSSCIRGTVEPSKPTPVFRNCP